MPPQTLDQNINRQLGCVLSLMYQLRKALLNDCLHTGPALHSLLQDILINIWIEPITLVGDTKQASYNSNQ